MVFVVFLALALVAVAVFVGAIIAVAFLCRYLFICSLLLSSSTRSYPQRSS